MTQDVITVNIITPQGFSSSIQAKTVQVKTALGRMEILPNHAPLQAMLKPGKLKVTPVNRKEKPTIMYIEQSGVIEVDSNQVTVLADNGFFGNELDQQALEKSEKELRKKLATNSAEALSETLEALNEINEKLKIVEGIRHESTRS